ncbi:MAG: hypothetical protein ACJ739_06275 [Acidimicrobiales bacterium]
MTHDPGDDLEPRLGDHLRARASRVSSAPDLADVHRRIDGRRQARTRALGVALAIALVAGPALGFALARSTEPDVDAVTAAGGAARGGRRGGDGTAPTYLGDGSLQNEISNLGSQLDRVSARTTEAGIRLVVHTSGLGPPTGPCVPDGVVRVGVADGDVIDVVVVESAPGAASFVIAGTADDRPMWVVVARGFEDVEATFPNGAVDSTRATDGLAVLAASADPGQSADALADDTVELGGTPMEDQESTRPARLADGYAGCPSPPTEPVEPPQTMPAAGEQPADPDAARAEVEALFLDAFKGPADPDGAHLRERPNVWWDASVRFREEHPDYYEWAKEVYSTVEDVVFTAPDRASVRYTLKTDDPEVPAPGERIGEAVLVDGTWKVSIETSCGNVGLAGIECDYSIEG